jgi:hypothetical protein
MINKDNIMKVEINLIELMRYTTSLLYEARIIDGSANMINRINAVKETDEESFKKAYDNLKDSVEIAKNNINNIYEIVNQQNF